MKIHNRLLWLIITMIMAINVGCKKESTVLRPGDPDTPVIPIQENTAPVVYAGGDLFAWPLLNEVELNGYASDNENNISVVSWAKISGPNSYKFENKDSLQTKISGLEAGTYQFELTVTDKMNLYDQDTMVVNVGEISGNPKGIIFKDLVWTFYWSSDIEIRNFVSNIPPGSMFKIFIQRDNDPEWKEVPRETGSWPGLGFYEYSIPTNPNGPYDNDSLFITYYGFDVDDTPNVKIVY